MRHSFIARDRIIAALADAVFVTEAAAKSGSLHTAGFALDLGKPVMAVPGPITSETSIGTNHLIKTGDITVTEVPDILLALSVPIKPTQQSLPILDGPEAVIVQALQKGIADGNSLQKISNTAVASFAQTITMVEVHGVVRSLGNDRWALA